LQATPMQIALAWLLQRSSNILLIPGTTSVAHLRENLGAAAMQLPSDIIVQLDGIAGGTSTVSHVRPTESDPHWRTERQTP
jgi:aryl-alcohol dehydrogenase-like predicted oxidoreductase